MAREPERAEEAFSALPSVERVRSALGDEHPHAVSVVAARRAIDAARGRIRAGQPAPSFDAVVDAARELLEGSRRSRLIPVINATGVLLHTNLGRAPLGPRQIDAVARVAAGYSNLEYELGTGDRGSRHAHVAEALRALTGAEAALVVNNNAAAVLVCMAALCGGREVIVSRGELVEIGGEFRIPDVLDASGARLVEVGTTNRTRVGDYERAITSDTAAMLKVHPSNYRVVGFSGSVAPHEVARLARGKRILFIHDIGSGLMSDGFEMTSSEPSVARSVEDGADIVTFSGDKLLGGPQAGVIVGRSELISKIARHPLMRPMRVDKLTLAALDETLQIYLEARPEEELPLWVMASATSESLLDRATQLSNTVGDEISEDLKLEVQPHRAVTGGGSLPGEDIASFALSIVHPTKGAAEIERALRFGEPPVVALIEDDRVLFDMRTVSPDQDIALGEALIAALR